MPVVIIVILVFIVAMIAIHSNNKKFDEARRDFEGDPTNLEKKRRLIDAGRAQGTKSSAAFQVMTIISEAEDRAKRQNKNKAEFTDQLATLGNLHEKGVLSDEEFQKAKAKLLGT